MKTVLKKVLFFVMFGLMVVCVKPVKAQCSQCAVAVTSNSKSGDTITNGLNKGILFLLAMPYLVVGAAGYIWYKKYRRKNVNLEMRNEKLHLN